MFTNLLHKFTHVNTYLQIFKTYFQIFYTHIYKFLDFFTYFSYTQYSPIFNKCSIHILLIHTVHYLHIFNTYVIDVFLT